MASVWDQLKGHRTQIAMFRRSATRGRLAQSYLLAGPPGVGKRKFAEILAQCLFCQKHALEELEACGDCPGCRPYLAGVHPDFVLLALRDGKRELSIGQFVGDDAKRGREGLNYELSMKPIQNGRKIAIIDDADTMNTEATNAFLKTLEEPPEGCVLLLVASNPDALLPTIRSRCQLVRFGGLAANDVSALLLETGAVDSQVAADSAAAIADGSLSQARKLIDDDWHELRDNLISALSQKSLGGLGAAAGLQAQVQKLSSETSEQRLYVAFLLRTAIEFYRSALWVVCVGAESPTGFQGETDAGFFLIPDAGEWVKHVPLSIEEIIDDLGAAVDHLGEGIQSLEMNGGVQLLLERALSKLGQLRVYRLPTGKTVLASR